ncbi:MAG TPA: zinc-dependent alcohol dehydrogenase family protein [Opitutaceae bacterium]|jgi:propanol-preferring alcohol dehydrogenase
MVLREARRPLVLSNVGVPEPGSGEVLLRVSACAVCRTDLHVVDGELAGPKLPLIPGHEIVGVVEATGGGTPFTAGERLGLPWLGWTCGECAHCRSGRENLCEKARFTGYTLDGGYAEFVRADARYCLRIPDGFTDEEAAPLLCAGLIGFRSYRRTADAATIGIYGFGAAAHIVSQVARYEGRRIFAFTRAGDGKGQEFARRMGASWAGNSDDRPPEPMDAAIIFAPVGALVPKALLAVRRGGCVVCGGIHMSDIPSFPYSSLWHERSVCSVANLTRRDGEEFLPLARRAGVKTETKAWRLEDANAALEALRKGVFNGANVLVVRQ